MGSVEILPNTTVHLKKPTMNDLPEEYRQFLHNVASNFEGNIKRIISQSIARDKTEVYRKTFDEVGLIQNQNAFFLNNISYRAFPQYEMNHLKVDFKNMCLHLDFFLKTVSVESDYLIATNFLEVNFKQKGKLRVTINDVTIKGRVGLFIKYDSFVPEIYDTDIDYRSVNSEVLDSVPSEEGDVDHLFIKFKTNLLDTNEKHKESKILSMFLIDMEKELLDKLNRLIAGTVVEFSMSEILCDEPMLLENYAKETVKYSNQFMEDWLKEFQEVYISEPYLKLTEACQIMIVHQNQKYTIKLSPGKIKNLETLTIINNIHSFQDTDENVYTGHLGAYNFGCTFDFINISTENIFLTTEMLISSIQCKFFVRVVISNEGERSAEMKLIDMDDFEIEVAMFGYEEIVEALKEELTPYIRGYIRTNLDELLKNIVEKFNN